MNKYYDESNAGEFFSISLGIGLTLYVASSLNAYLAKSMQVTGEGDFIGTLDVRTVYLHCQSIF